MNGHALIHCNSITAEVSRVFSDRQSDFSRVSIIFNAIIISCSFIVRYNHYSERATAYRVQYGRWVPFVNFSCVCAAAFWVRRCSKRELRRIFSSQFASKCLKMHSSSGIASLVQGGNTAQSMLLLRQNHPCDSLW